MFAFFLSFDTILRIFCGRFFQNRLNRFSLSLSFMPKHGKKYRSAAKKIDANKTYPLSEAVKLARETSTTKFDATMEIHVRTGADPKYADQIVRASITLPHGTGKTQRIAVFCDGAEAAAATKAGADIVGGDDLIEKVLAGEINFDIAVATPALMKNLAKAAKILGPKGLMPSPKSGTVTPKPAEAVADLKKGKMEFRTDKNGIVHSLFGKASFSEKNLIENVTALLRAITEAKPSGVKSNYIRSIFVTSSMGPSVAVDAASLS